MLRQVAVGLVAGVAFLVLDGVLNANPLAQDLYAVYQPIARASVNALAGSAIDLTYGLILAAVFVVLRPSLPGATNLQKGISFGVMLWFLRVVMRVAGEWVMTVVSAQVHAYTLGAGLVQALVVGCIIALLLAEPRRVATA
jgi:hypothetical protein